MKTLELTKDLYWTGTLDPALKTFDIIMETKYGTTYNSYVLCGSEASCVIETSKARFEAEYLDTLDSLALPSPLRYLIVNHTEPDHAGSAAALLARNPGLTVVGTPTAITFLKHIVHREFVSLPVKDGSTLSLGDKTLRFRVAPNLHWPDTMYTFWEEGRALFTCDSFGAHYSSDAVLRSRVTDEAGYWDAAKYYFDNILGPFRRPYMQAGLAIARSLHPAMICPGHGPVLDAGLDELFARYDAWCAEGQPFPRKTVVIPFVTAYGYTGQLAEKLAEGLRDSGEVDVKCYDLQSADKSQVLGDIARAQGLLLGSPTILADALKPVWDLVTDLYSPIHKGKLASAFGSYGWSGEAVPHLVERLRQLRMNVPDEGFRVRFKPGENDLVNAYEYGYNFGCILQKRDNDHLGKKPPARRLVKCLVCGEIFDASLEVCPVCGVGRENFVPVEDSAVAAKQHTDRRFLILGGGAAGLNAAKAIRERDDGCSIVMLTQEHALPYNRPMLTKSLAAGLSAAQLAMEDENWFEQNRVFILTGKRVLRADAQAREVVCEDGTTLRYDTLIYALGAQCFVPPIPGSDRDSVVAIRTIEDAQRVRERAQTARDAVVIGGGVLGLEAAWELQRLGLAVTVLEAAPQIMGRQIDGETAQLLVEKAQGKGIALHTGVSIDAIGEAAVTLKDGRSFPAQLVIVSAGVRANVQLAEQLGLRVDRAVVVDDGMRTSRPDVFACGDCAVMDGVNYALWSEAVEQGRVAGANAAGDALHCDRNPGAVTLNALETSLFAQGDLGKGEGKRYRTVEMRDDVRGSFAKYWFLSGKLCGVSLLGDVTEMPRLSQQLKDGADFATVMGR